MERKKALVLGSIIVAAFIFGVTAVHQTLRQSKPVEMKMNGFLSIGKSSAPIDIVLIEDFRCKNCRHFSERILPKIYSEYVQTGKARFTLVPISYFKGSQALANAALEVYQRHPSRFFNFLKEAFAQTEGVDLKKEEIIQLAQRIGGINVGRLQTAIEKGAYDAELDQNLAWAHSLMGARFRTPALYINGISTSTLSFAAIEERVKQLLEKTP